VPLSVLFDAGLQTISAGTTNASGPGVSFANANGVTFGMVGNTITASIGAVATGAIGAISGGTTQITSGTAAFSNANNISFGVVGNTITASASFLAATTPISVFSQGGIETNYSLSNGQISFQKVSLPMPISASSGLVLMDIAGHSNSSGAITVFVGAYAISSVSASALSSASGAITWASGSDPTQSSVYGGISGTRYRSFGWGSSLTPGDYLFALAISTQNDGTARIFGRQGVNIVGPYAGAETLFFIDGVSNSTSNAFPAVVLASDTNYVRTGLSAAQQPGFLLIGTF
jgi:hypothetical protein